MSLQNLLVNDPDKYFLRLNCRELTTKILNVDSAVVSNLNVNKVTAVEVITDTLADKWVTVNTTASGIYSVPIPIVLKYKMIYENVLGVATPIGITLHLPEILSTQDVSPAPLFIDWTVPLALIPTTTVYVTCAVAHNFNANAGLIEINNAGGIIVYNYITGLPQFFSGAGLNRGMHRRTFSYLF